MRSKINYLHIQVQLNWTNNIGEKREVTQEQNKIQLYLD